MMHKHNLLYGNFWTAVRRLPDGAAGGNTDPARAAAPAAPPPAPPPVDPAPAVAVDQVTATQPVPVAPPPSAALDQAAAEPAPVDPPAPVAADPTATLATALRSHAAFHAELAEHGPSLGWPGKLIEMCKQVGEDFLAAAQHLEQFVVKEVKSL